MCFLGRTVSQQTALHLWNWSQSLINPPEWKTSILPFLFYLILLFLVVPVVCPLSHSQFEIQDSNIAATIFLKGAEEEKDPVRIEARCCAKGAWKSRPVLSWQVFYISFAAFPTNFHSLIYRKQFPKILSHTSPFFLGQTSAHRHPSR